MRRRRRARSGMRSIFAIPPLWTAFSLGIVYKKLKPRTLGVVGNTPESSERPGAENGATGNKLFFQWSPYAGIGARRPIVSQYEKFVLSELDIDRGSDRDALGDKVRLFNQKSVRLFHIINFNFSVRDFNALSRKPYNPFDEVLTRIARIPKHNGLSPQRRPKII